MKIERNNTSFELTAAELETAYRERHMQYLVEDAKHRSEDCLDQDYLDSMDEADYEIIAEMFDNEHDCNIADNDQWYHIIKRYKTIIDRSHFYPKTFNTPWGSIVLSENRLEIHDEDGELFDYVSLEGKSVKYCIDEFDYFSAKLSDGDLSFAMFLFSRFQSAILVGQINDEKYENAKAEYGEEYVNKFGGYFLVVKE